MMESLEFGRVETPGTSAQVVPAPILRASFQGAISKRELNDLKRESGDVTESLLQENIEQQLLRTSNESPRQRSASRAPK